MSGVLEPGLLWHSLGMPYTDPAMLTPEPGFASDSGIALGWLEGKDAKRAKAAVSAGKAAMEWRHLGNLARLCAQSPPLVRAAVT